MKTLIVEYENSRIKEEFIQENKDSLGEFNIIWVHKPMVNYIDITLID